MESLSQAEETIKQVRGSLSSWVRNDYEQKMLTDRNLTKLGEARLLLKDFSGERITNLVAQLDELTKTIINCEAAYQNQSGASTNAFAVKFEGNDVMQKEMEEAEVALKQQEKCREDKRRARRAGAGRRIALLTEEEEPTNSSEGQPSGLTAGVPENEVAERPSRQMKSLELARFSSQTSADIPPAVLTSEGDGGVAFPIPGTGWVGLEFDWPVEFDMKRCYCRVELYRSIFSAAMQGKPLTGLLPSGPLEPQDDTEGVDDEEGSEEDNGDQSAEELTTLQMLSQQLIHEYEDDERAEAEADASVGSMVPLRFSAESISWLRGFSSSSVWTIILCHGGCFAGGIFHGTSCIRHKSFQRYVVRKKQGGKQSNAQRDGGSFGSIGSQIRAANELKWRIDARDLILEWKRYIDASSIVLYVAPGPSNRSILMDFSVVPASAGKTGVQSPINAKDPRVKKVPFTTHKPSFAEVKRIYEEAREMRVVYVQ